MKLSRTLVRLLALAIVLSVRAPVVVADDTAPAEESWDALYMGNDKVGYAHTVIRNAREKTKS